MLEQKPGNGPAPESRTGTTIAATSEAKPPELKKTASPRRFWRWRFALPAVTLVLLLLGLYGFFTFNAVRSHITSGTAHFQAAVDQARNDSASLNLATLDKLKQELSAGEKDFRQAREAAGPVALVLPLFGWLPGPGYDLSQLPGFLEIAEKTAKSGVLVLDGASPALAAFDPNAPTSGPAGSTASGKLTQAALALARPEAQANFNQASILLAEIADRRAGLDRSRLGLDQTRKAVDQLDQQLPALRDGLQLARELPPLLPAVLGTDKPVSYLTLIENSDELRATGGFISAVGLLTLDKGKLSLSDFSDSYGVDNQAVKPETPPAPLAHYMKAGQFLLRDANWWPDFPTSARKVAELYQLHQGRAVDNVLAVDSRAVAYLFEALGPLDLPSYNERLTAENFEERLRFYYLPPGTVQNGEWWHQRKAFMGVVLTGLLGKLNGASARDFIKVATSLGQAVTEKHLQIYSTNPDLQKQLSQRNLAGAQLPPPAADSGYNLNDYLMLVDSNVGFNKVSPNVERKAAYQFSSGGPGASLFASLTLTYTNKAGVREGTTAGECVKIIKYDSSYESMMNGCYWNYLRVYVPAGSRLLNSNGFPADDPPATGQENNLTFFASQLVVPPGETVTVTLNYILPGALPEKPAYRLDVQKQAGSRATPLTVKVTWPGFSQQWTEQLNRDLAFKQAR
ncbi:MAG: hypothetical protein JWP00_4896 [Chloroflexi bacterium]|nr:hypothetical protein [Chloroflexota bacterium]